MFETSDKLSLSSQSASQEPLDKGAGRSANVMLITLKGVIREMEHVIVSLVTKANTAQKVSTT